MAGGIPSRPRRFVPLFDYRLLQAARDLASTHFAEGGQLTGVGTAMEAAWRRDHRKNFRRLGRQRLTILGLVLGTAGGLWWFEGVLIGQDTGLGSARPGLLGWTAVILAIVAITMWAKSRRRARESAAAAVHRRERVLKAAESWSSMSRSEQCAMKRHAALREAGSTAKSILLTMSGLDGPMDVGEGFADRDD